jgi:peptidoglycan/LPS O-acetylase OafA/YrhL
VHGFFWDGNWTLFACGVAVYAYRQQTRVWIPIALACALAWSLWHVASVKEADVPVSLIIASTFALGLIVLQPFDAQISSTARLKPLFWCGVRCYSIYLVHWTVTHPLEGALSATIGSGLSVTMLLILPATIGATLLVAAPFHRWIERPCMNMVLVRR